MDIRQLQYFLTLSQQEHMSGAAEALNISQPALSQSIRSLERELGIELFDRQHNRIRLNANGRDFAVYAEQSLHALEMGKRAVQASRYQFRGLIRIHCFAFADLLIDCISDYMRLNPDVRVELYQQQLGQEKLRERVDFILSGHGNNDLEREWTSRALFTEEWYVVISPRYREYPKETEALSPVDLKEDLFVGDFIVSRVFTYLDQLHRVCNEAGFQPKIFMTTDDFLTKMRIVDEGLAITMLPKACLRIAKKLSPDLRTFRLSGVNTSRTVYFMRKKETQLSETAMDFWEFVNDYYK